MPSGIAPACGIDPPTSSLGGIRPSPRRMTVATCSYLIDKNIVQRIDSHNLTLVERWTAGLHGATQ